ncbi:unnamed protein product [Rangifer tarandus platyrhynchus]|uniref:Uncharacterized protein n=1 Tax=Rangifer tarandus platyrhynchus TaxID=3082113 RepID=A0AC59ZT43_RANTA
MHRQLLPKCSVRDICRAAVAPSGRNIFIIEMPQKETSEGWMKMASVFPEPQGPGALNQNKTHEGWPSILILRGPVTPDSLRVSSLKVTSRLLLRSSLASKPAKPGWSDVCPKTPFLEAVGLLDIPVRPEFLTSHRLPSTHPPGC